MLFVFRYSYGFCCYTVVGLVVALSDQMCHSGIAKLGDSRIIRRSIETTNLLFFLFLLLFFFGLVVVLFLVVLLVLVVVLLVILAVLLVVLLVVLVQIVVVA